MEVTLWVKGNLEMWLMVAAVLLLLLVLSLLLFAMVATSAGQFENASENKLANWMTTANRHLNSDAAPPQSFVRVLRMMRQRFTGLTNRFQH